MAVRGRKVDSALLLAARPLIESFAAESPGSEVGFVLLHRARPANFVLAHIWDGVDLLQRYWTSPFDDPTELTPHRAGAIGCIWELEVTGHERDLWAELVDDPHGQDQLPGFA